MENTKNIKKILGKLGPLLALIVLSAVLTAASPNFLTINNVMNILRQTAVNGLIASGMLVVLITAGIDLSVGANAVLCACIMGMFVDKFGISNPVVLLGAGNTYGNCNRMYQWSFTYEASFTSSICFYIRYEKCTCRIGAVCSFHQNN